jgi:glycosyltransferase involved in cell wall biosynthesis
MPLSAYPETKFILIGGGPEKDAIVRRAHEIGAAGAIVFLESPSRPECIDLKRAADIVVVPSRNEPFGIVVLEAWAAGKPVVATLAGGPREFIWHDVNGFLVDPNPGGLAHGIGSLLADHEHCRALGANGRRAVEDRFHWDNVAAFTEGVYHATLH